MRTPHNAEGHLLSLGSPLDGLAVTECRGADISASESLSRPAVLARPYDAHGPVSPRLNVTFQCVATPREQATAVTMEIKPPAPRALAALDLPTPVLPDKPLRITDKVRRAINLFVAGDCKQITEAAAKVGLARESLGKALDRPHVIAYLQQRTRKRLEILAGRAGAVKGELLDSDNEMVRDRASSFVLGLAGIQPDAAAALSINLEIKAGYVIDLSDEPRAAPRTIGQ